MNVWNLFLISLRMLLGLLFLASGLLKLYPIEPFELNFIDLGVGNWYTAPFVARLLIAFELLIGLLLLFNVLLKKFTLKATLILLAFFTFYLVLQILREGNAGSCGCFGTYLKMTPMESVIKNFMLFGIAFFLLRFHPDNTFRFTKHIVLLSIIVCLVTPFILNPIDMMASGYRQPEATSFPFDGSLLSGGTIAVKPIPDLSHGKHIVAFLSMTCPHCKSLAFKMHVMEKRHPEIPFFLVLNGKENNLQPFLEETRVNNVPYMILHGMPFAKITGGSVPTVYWIENGMVKKKSLYISLEESEVLKWLNGGTAD